MARVHAASFTLPRPWSEAEIRALLVSPLVFALTEAGAGFLLGRVVADEAELLTLAVDPTARRAGLGRKLVAAFLAEATRRGAATAFLEVAAPNLAALALYRAMGFAETGRRRGYYRGTEDIADAVVMGRPLRPDVPVSQNTTPSNP